MKPRAVSFLELLRTSLWYMARDAPRAYSMLLRAIPGSVSIQVDQEILLVRVESGRLMLQSGRYWAPVSLQTSREAILSLIDGRLRLLAAVKGGQLSLYGKAPDLIGFDVAFRAYVHGAVRSSAFPELLARYRNTGHE